MFLMEKSALLPDVGTGTGIEFPPWLIIHIVHPSRSRHLTENNSHSNCNNPHRSANLRSPHVMITDYYGHASCVGSISYYRVFIVYIFYTFVRCGPSSVSPSCWRRHVGCVRFTWLFDSLVTYLAMTWMSLGTLTVLINLDPCTKWRLQKNVEARLEQSWNNLYAESLRRPIKQEIAFWR